MRVGILGGSFNPPHAAHRALADAALADGRVARVVWIPAGHPPHKPGVRLALPEHRLAMTRRLVADDPRMAVSDIELRRDGPSFTVDTVRALRASHPEDGFRLLIGWDMAATFATWREAAALAEEAPPLIAWRPDAERGAEGPDPAALPPMLASAAAEGWLTMPPSNVSSTRLRALLADGADDATLLAAGLTPPVLAYIREHALY